MTLLPLYLGLSCIVACAALAALLSGVAKLIEWRIDKKVGNHEAR